MNFQVPQFIEIEDKLIGPLSFKQFIYVAGSIGLGFIIYVYLPIYLSLIPATAVVGVGMALAFLKINDRPFIVIMQSALRYFISRKLYLWEKRDKPLSPKTQAEVLTLEAGLNPVSKSRLSDLSWNLDVSKKIN